MKKQDMEQPDQSMFPTTRWTLVDWAANPNSPTHEKGLNELLGRYLPALKAHLTRVRGLSHDYADDIAQGFVADKILRGELLTHANAKRGRFRTFLLTALDRYMFNQVRNSRTRRRSPEHGPPASLDDIEEVVGVSDTSPVFDLAWVREIIDETLRRVERDCRGTGREHYWTLFEDRVVNPLLRDQQSRSYRDLVTDLGFRSPMQASNALFTTKRMFERLFREVVQEYAGDQREVDEEIAELRAILAEGSG